jgi:hypothetical protein
MCCWIGMPAAPQDAPQSPQSGVQSPVTGTQSSTHKTQSPATGLQPQPPDSQLPIPLPKNALLPINLSFQVWNGLMVVDTIVNKVNVRRFVIDPGLDACTLTPNAAENLTLASTPQLARVAIYDRSIMAQQAQIAQLQFNTLKVDNVPVGLIDVFALLSPAVARRLDAPVGWLGAPFLSAFQVTIDYEKHYIVLNRPDAPPLKEAGAIAIPIELREGRVLLKVSLPGARPFSALFSASAPVTVIPTLAAQQAHLKAIEMVPFMQPGGKPGKLGRVVLPKLSIGKLSVEGMNAVFVAPDAPSELDHSMAVLGPDLLRHYKVTINYAKRMMILTPPPTVKKPDTDEVKPDKPKGRGKGTVPGMGSGTGLGTSSG